MAVLASVLFYAGAVEADALLYFGYVLALATVLGVLGFFVYSIVEKPKQVKSVALLIVGAVALTLLCYAVSSTTTMGLDPELERVTSAGAIRWSEAGIYGMYILFAGAFLSILVSSVRNMIK